VPDFAQARFDLRYLRIGDRIATEQRWHEMIKHTFVPDVQLTLEMEPYHKEPMVCTSETIKLARQAQAIAHTLGFSLDHELTGGASDASFTSELGIPTLDGLGPNGGLDHSPNEYILKSSIAPRSALLAGLIMGINA
jgi:glutamate carboxypeptidase